MIKYYVPKNTEVFICFHGEEEFLLTHPVRTIESVYMDVNDILDASKYPELPPSYSVFIPPYDEEFEVAMFAVQSSKVRAESVEDD